MMEQSALAVWYYKSNTRRQAPLVMVQGPDSRHGSTAAVRLGQARAQACGAGEWGVRRSVSIHSVCEQKESYLKDDAIG